jgi:metal-responsive CopG/Arc/MetJ family transcriptional regulator|tara:strand:+ start:251 stop:433 length:183 start_codon:yes stop_codon:yes gene_type:complete
LRKSKISKGKMLVSLPRTIIDGITELAEETDSDKSEVIETILEDVLDDPDKLDELFGEVE